MRLRAGICGLLLGTLGGCEMIPQILRVEVDDRVVEVKPKSAPTELPSNQIQPEPASNLLEAPDDPPTS